MERRDRTRYEYDDYDQDYDSNAAYSRNDEHYHSARNLTNEFEQDYQRDRSHRDDDHTRSGHDRRYNQGRFGSDYDQNRRESGGFSGYAENQWNDRDRNRNYSGYSNRDSDRFSNYQDNYRGDQGTGRRDSDIRRGYGISSYDGTSDRFNTLDRDRNRRGEDEQAYSGSRDGYRSSRFSGGMGESFPSSSRGIPDTSYGHRSFADDYGTGMGSTYGATNYGGGTGYSGGHQGGSYGSNSTSGSSSGNYGAAGSMDGGTYSGRSSSGRGETSRNSEWGGHY